MRTKTLHRTANDNVYFHKDFHGALCVAIQYMQDRFGVKHVRKYLQNFTRKFYKPLNKKIKKVGLKALKQYFIKIYKTENGKITLTLNNDAELLLVVHKCPVISFLRGKKYKIPGAFIETTRTVNNTLCEGTKYAYKLIEYNPRDGYSVQKFYRKKRVTYCQC